MSDLIVYSSGQLPAEITEVLTALKSQFIKGMSDEELFDHLKALITKCFVDAGYNQPENSVYFVTEVLNDVRQACKWNALRKDELSIAFYKGIRKHYGDFVGLPITRFSEFITGYVKDQSRIQALAEKNKPLDEKSEPSESEKFNIAKWNALRAYNDVKEGRSITMYGSIVYDFLNGLKMIEITNEAKKEFINEARNQLIRENEIKTVGLLDKIKIAEIITNLNLLRTEEKNANVLKRAKCLTLVSWLQGILIEEVDLEKLINECTPT